MLQGKEKDGYENQGRIQNIYVCDMQGVKTAAKGLNLYLLKVPNVRFTVLLYSCSNSHILIFLLLASVEVFLYHLL